MVDVYVTGWISRNKKKLLTHLVEGLSTGPTAVRTAEEPGASSTGRTT
jgi:hypothetical protein